MALPPRFGPINPCHRGLEVEAPSLPWFLVNFRPENYDIRYPREYLLVPRLAKAIFFPFIFMRSQGLGPHADLCQRWIDFPSQERSNPSTRATGAIFEVGSDWWSPHVPPTHVWGLSPKNTVVIVKLLDYNGLYIYTHILYMYAYIAFPVAESRRVTPLHSHPPPARSSDGNHRQHLCLSHIFFPTFGRCLFQVLRNVCPSWFSEFSPTYH